MFFICIGISLENEKALYYSCASIRKKGHYYFVSLYSVDIYVHTYLHIY